MARGDVKVRVFTLQLDAESPAFQDGEVRDFVEAHAALGVHEHLPHHEGDPPRARRVTFGSGADGRLA